MACVVGALGVVVTLSAVSARAGGFEFQSVGVRYGFGANFASSQFHQVEGFVDLNLPWGLDLGKQWRVQTLLDGSAGWLGDSGINGGIFQVGPAVRIGREHFPLSISGGINPTLLTTARYEEQYFGTQFQFTSYVTATVRLVRHVEFGYRFQHMSNAGLAPTNPGLNMNVLFLSYAF
jgi:hypothetical protein